MKPLKTAFLITLVAFFISIITANNSYSLERYENSECTEPEEMVHGSLFFFLALEVEGIADHRQSLGVPALEYDGTWPPLEKSFEGSNYGIWSVSDESVCQQLQQFVDDNDTLDTLSKYYYQTETHYFIYFTGRKPTMISYSGKPYIFVFDIELNYLGMTR
ncbi:MAG: hypothetical protein EA390_08410 [Balneolaceae bacterium]|nr:MAG: hypothetical protein EA390_08410 [Balneolaceae bacterium]